MSGGKFAPIARLNSQLFGNGGHGMPCPYKLKVGRRAEPTGESDESDRQSSERASQIFRGARAHLRRANLRCVPWHLRKLPRKCPSNTRRRQASLCRKAARCKTRRLHRRCRLTGANGWRTTTKPSPPSECAFTSSAYALATTCSAASAPTSTPILEHQLMDVHAHQPRQQRPVVAVQATRSPCGSSCRGRRARRSARRRFRRRSRSSGAPRIPARGSDRCASRAPRT